MLPLVRTGVSPHQSTCPSQTDQSPQLDEKASAAVLSLKKIQSRAEIGADYRSFSSALTEAYFSHASKLREHLHFRMRCAIR
jgi:hypothetical protein